MEASQLAMSKQKRQREQRSQRQRSAPKQAMPKQISRSETIALALGDATSAAGRERARAYIQEYASPVVAAREVFLAYADAAERVDSRAVVACHAGCWFCCTTPVAVTVFEAAMVRSAILTLPEVEQQAILLRLQEHVAAQDQAFAAAGAERISFRRRCPLLTDEGMCSVYEGRPLACRSVLSLDAERCRRWYLEYDQGDPNTLFALTNNAAISGIAQLMVTLNEGNLDHYPSYELASALYKLWTEPDSFVTWQQGELYARDGFPRMAEGDAIFPTPAGMPIGPPTEVVN
jgi:Fe-S-cluster containining protein